MSKRKAVGIGCLLCLFFVAPFAFVQRASAVPLPPLSTFLIDPAFESLNVNDNFTVTVNITDVQDLFAWQVTLKYDGAGLRLNDLWVPDDNVFTGHEVFVQPYNNPRFCDIGACLYGDDLIADVDSGVICKANFTVMSAGQTGQWLIEIDDDPNMSFWMRTDSEGVHSQNIIGSSCTVFATSLLVGDVNGDYRVDMRDISIAALDFGLQQDDPRWNHNCDLNSDGKIDLRDIASIARNFGQHIP